jgi:hypothetical protein
MHIPPSERHMSKTLNNLSCLINNINDNLEVTIKILVVIVLIFLNVKFQFTLNPFCLP